MTAVFGYLLLAIVVFRALVWPSLKELRDVYRRKRLWRELVAARGSTTHRDPGRPRVPLAGPRRSAPEGAWPDGSGVSALRPAESGVEMARHRAVAAYVSRRLAVERDLAAQGQGLDELHVEEVPRG